MATVLRDLRDAWVIIALTLAVCLLAAAAVTLAQHDRYRAQGSVVVSPSRFLDPTGTDALPSLTATVVELSGHQSVLRPTGAAFVASAPDPATRARRAHEATLSWLGQNTHAVAVGTTSVIDLTGTATTNSDALDLTHAFVTSLTRFVRNARTHEPVAGAGGSGIGLVIVGSGASEGRISPTPVRNALIGLVAGIVLGVVLALAFGPGRRRRRAADAAAELGFPSLGVVRPGMHEPGGGLASAQRLLAALTEARGSLVVLLTGTAPAEQIGQVGETLVRSLERSGTPALLVDADRRGSALSRRMGAAGRPGLLDALDDDADPGERIVRVGPASGNGEVPVHLLPSGAAPARGELDAATMRALVANVRRAFSVVVLSGPTLGHTGGGDVAVLAAVADCWLLVADTNTTPRGIGDARSLIDQTTTPLMGLLSVDRDGARPGRVAWPA